MEEAMDQDMIEFIAYLQRLELAVSEQQARQIYAFVEQKEDNRLAREYNKDGVCPICGHQK